MRNLTLGLVLANFAFAAWSAWFAPAQRVGRRAEEGLRALTLVREVAVDVRSSGVVVEQGAAPESAAVDPPRRSDAPAAAAGELPVAAVSAGEEPRCTSVGPFRELSQAATAAATLRTAGFQPLQRVAEGDIWIGYWVYIGAIPTEAQANEILAKVREEGIADSYVIPNSDSGNLVSLGVFSEISGVGSRREQVRALGFDPQVVDRTRRATVYWVDVALAAGQALDFDSLQPAGRIIRLEQRDCPESAG